MTKELLFKYFRGECSIDEKSMIDGWLGESTSNMEIFKEAHTEYEVLVMYGNNDSCTVGGSMESGRLEGGLMGEGSRKGHDRTSGNVSAGRRIVRIITDAAAVVAIASLMTFFITENLRDRIAGELSSIEVPAGQHIDFTLSDGTKVKLNSGAVLSYPNAFARNSREVRLSGEAYFDVAHNDRKPFIVKTFASDIHVLGTKFNVDADECDARFSVSLVEGSVRIVSCLDPGKEIVMCPDEKVSLVNGQLTVEKKPAKSEIRWTEGILDISGLDFSGLMKRMEMAYGVRIVIDRDTLPELRYTDGELRISDGIDYALSVIENVADFTYTKDYRTGTIHIK